MDFTAKKYKAIFFDWDGTAVENRRAPVDKVLPPMIELLKKGVKLAIISGTTYNNIAGGALHTMIPADCLGNLYMGLGRGVYNYGFEKGEPVLIQDNTPDKKTLLKIHRLCYDFHEMLIDKYDFASDIVFTRPNYCKVDIMVGSDRGDKLFLQSSEIDAVNEELAKHGYGGGLRGLCDLAAEMGAERGVAVKATTDAKFIEIGATTKSDNVDFLVRECMFKEGIALGEMSFWGDEYTYLGEGITGSDYQMRTELTKEAEFYDVAPAPLRLPEGVTGLGGGIATFENFLKAQASM